VDLWEGGGRRLESFREEGERNGLPEVDVGPRERLDSVVHGPTRRRLRRRAVQRKQDRGEVLGPEEPHELRSFGGELRTK
jgi:hypothetical protein